MKSDDMIIGHEDLVLVTGAAGFVGSHVVESLLIRGFKRLRCLVRPSNDLRRLDPIIRDHGAQSEIEILRGNLLSRELCKDAARDAAVVYHLAAATGTKSFADAFLNSVVTTRNLLDAVLGTGKLRRFVNVSSFAVYSNRGNPSGGVLDENSPIESDPGQRAEAYCFAKAKQDQIVTEYGRQQKLPFVIVRPGVVFGPGKNFIPGRIGTDCFGIFLHMGGGNRLPLTYVENCADAIVLAGLKPGVDGLVFNIVDDDLPTCRRFLRLYKKHVRPIRSIYLPHAASYLFCWFWETYSRWSGGQLPPVFTRREWRAYWKRTRYSNARARELLGWEPRVPMQMALSQFFAFCRERGRLS